MRRTLGRAFVKGIGGVPEQQNPGYRVTLETCSLNTTPPARRPPPRTTTASPPAQSPLPSGDVVALR